MKVFLDTSFLMPFFGLDTTIKDLEKQLNETLEIQGLTYFFSPVSIIEIKWQIIKLEKSGINRDQFEEAFSNAVAMLKFDNMFRSVNLEEPTINDISYELQKLEHNDYFDTVIGASAMLTSDTFITQDEKLTKKMKLLWQNQTGVYPEIKIITWKKFYDIIK